MHPLVPFGTVVMVWDCSIPRENVETVFFWIKRKLFMRVKKSYSRVARTRGYATLKDTKGRRFPSLLTLCCTHDFIYISVATAPKHGLQHPRNQ